MCTRCFAVVASAAPNPALLILWLFTDLITHDFDSFIAPLLGLIFLPFTTIFYVLADDPTVVVTGIGWVFVFLGFLCALSSWPGNGYGGRRIAPDNSIICAQSALREK